MFLLPVSLLQKNKGRNLFLKNLAESPGEPIAKETAELMRVLHNARMRTLSRRDVDLGMNPNREPSHLFFKLSGLTELLSLLKDHEIYNCLAVCPALTVIDPQTSLPVAPTSEQIRLMQEAVTAEANNNHGRFAVIMKGLQLVQTVIIAGCTDKGDIIIDESTAFKYYDFAGQCCNTREGLDKDKCLKETYHRIQ